RSDITAASSSIPTTTISLPHRSAFRHPSCAIRRPLFDLPDRTEKIAPRFVYARPESRLCSVTVLRLSLHRQRPPLRVQILLRLLLRQTHQARIARVVPKPHARAPKPVAACLRVVPLQCRTTSKRDRVRDDAETPLRLRAQSR